MADDRERETERTTIVRSDGDSRGGVAIVIAVLAILALLAVLFFGGVFDRDDEQDLNVDINQPAVNVIMPQTQVPVVVPEPVPMPPDVNVNVTTPPPEPIEENLGNTENTNSG